MFRTLITPTELSARYTRATWVILDCRYDIDQPEKGRTDYHKGHIANAIYVDLDTDISKQMDGTNGRHPLPSDETLVDLVETLGISNHHQVVVYDDECGGYAARMWWILKYLGHADVAVLDGGLQAWISAGNDVDNGEVQRTRSEFQADVQPDRLVTLSDLADILQTPSVTLLDARAPERYRGDEEPLDPIAGHIPGAQNRYWRANLAPDGTFKSQEQLRLELSAFIKDGDVRDAVVYCGSGVTACHNLLAFMHAGFEMPKLYAGSWSEWSSDAGRGYRVGDESA